MKRIVNALGKLSWAKKAYAVFVLCATTAVALPAQTFTTLFSFDRIDGAYPQAALVQGTDGNFYGTTGMTGGANGGGTVFKITPSGTLTTLYNFCAQISCTDGDYPIAGLVQAPNGDFYGTTIEGGAYGYGTVFKISPSGTLTTLYSFCSQSGCYDGEGPVELVRTTNGDFYGTTYGGGTAGGGTFFKITPSGTLTTLYSFCSQSECTDGASPEGLVQAPNGDFYGTTNGGGTYGYGTIFKISPSGALTTLYSFCSQNGCPDGYNPWGLVQATNGDFYGTTLDGGANCVQHTPFGCGTVFKITPSGTLTTLVRFCSESGCTNGGLPYAGLVQATDGNLYGTTGDYGGRGAGGTIFRITPSGTLTTLYRFCSQVGCPDGQQPVAALLQGTNGDFYGTAGRSGAYGYGTVFSLSVGLGPFVEPQTTSGSVGATVKILGTDLTGATSVSFNGTAAVFKVVSSSLIITTVPTGASSGTVQVVTPGGTLSSNVAFRVLP